MTDAHCIVLCTVPDAATAESLARALVEARLAACVNVLPGLTSVYRWQGQIQQDNELLLIAKTRRENFDALCTTLRGLHPYELPEIIAVPVIDGLPAYLGWIDQNLEHPT
ncbi:MAG: divalent-cation tolerance protein CutA [Gammaproteobacteria bacterium]|nr:divalent-cation tolerance protein CutA [Gammaproteobacteria bacterium]